jgi:hypothetical protein
MAQSDKNSMRSSTTEWKQIENIAASSIYTANNPYLSAEEKLEVAMWFTLPTNLTTYCLLGMATYSNVNSLSYLTLFGVPLIINFCLGLANWLFYSKALTQILYRTLFNPLIMLTIKAAFFVFLGSKGNYFLAIFIILLSFGIQPLLEPSMWLIDTHFGRKFKMNPQYAFFKKFYGYNFPFESEEMQ